MMAVIFEVTPAPGRQADYLEQAALLRPLLEQADGFISVERFSSLTQEGRILSLSFWRDEAAVQAWRSTAEHRLAQQAGRDGIFSDYRLRVCSVQRDYGLAQREQAPQDSRDALR